MCQHYAEGGEAAFVTRMDQMYGRCDVCGRGKFWHTWYCEGHERHEEWKASGMYHPDKAITRKHNP